MITKSVFGSALGAGFVAFAAAPALAQDSVTDRVEEFLANTQKQVEQAKLWKFEVHPSLRESVIWTDNVFLNDRGEDPLILRSMTTPGGTIVRNRSVLDRFEERHPAFRDRQSQGRVDDFIIQSELGVDLRLPVNEEYSRAFQQKYMTILGLKVRNQEYLDVNELDNTSVFLDTDVFGFLSDLLNAQWGNVIWVRFRDSFSRLNDPLDASILQLNQTGLTSIKDFQDFERTENTANLDVGYTGNMIDAVVGYENYHLLLDDEELDQAEHTRHGFHAEVGTQIPGWQGKRAFARYDQWLYNFARAPQFDAAGNEVAQVQVLNDAQVHRTVVGVDGKFFSDRIFGRGEAGYLWWNTDNDGATGDERDWGGVVGLVRLRYTPWEERRTWVQFEYERTVQYSAISNWNAIHEGVFSIGHEIIPKRLDADFTLALSRVNPSDGPHRVLFEGGIGAVYHLYPQLDLSLRYLYRRQVSEQEIITTSAFATGSGRLFNYEIRSDGDFYQNILELALLLHF